MTIIDRRTGIVIVSMLMIAGCLALMPDQCDGDEAPVFEHGFTPEDGMFDVVKRYEAISAEWKEKGMMEFEFRDPVPERKNPEENELIDMMENKFREGPKQIGPEIIGQPMEKPPMNDRMDGFDPEFLSDVVDFLDKRDFMPNLKKMIEDRITMELCMQAVAVIGELAFADTLSGRDHEYDDDIEDDIRVEDDEDEEEDSSPEIIVEDPDDIVAKPLFTYYLGVTTGGSTLLC